VTDSDAVIAEDMLWWRSMAAPLGGSGGRCGEDHRRCDSRTAVTSRRAQTEETIL
jgi:hypothetical protein